MKGSSYSSTSERGPLSNWSTAADSAALRTESMFRNLSEKRGSLALIFTDRQMTTTFFLALGFRGTARGAHGEMRTLDLLRLLSLFFALFVVAESSVVFGGKGKVSGSWQVGGYLGGLELAASISWEPEPAAVVSMPTLGISVAGRDWASSRGAKGFLLLGGEGDGCCCDFIDDF